MAKVEAWEEVVKAVAVKAERPERVASTARKQRRPTRAEKDQKVDLQLLCHG